MKKALNALRKDSRLSIRDLAREAEIPVSRAGRMIRQIEKEGIAAYKPLLDYQKLNLLKFIYIIPCHAGDASYLARAAEINNLYSIRGGILCECIFRDFREMYEFQERLDEYFPEYSRYQVVEDIAQEMMELG